MADNELIVEDNSTEIVETTTEEIVEDKPTPKTYTQEEVNEIVGRRLARNEARIKKEYEKKYGELETVLKAGTGKDDVKDMTNAFRDFYKSKGIDVPEHKPKYSERETEILVKAEADEIINAGYDDVVEEVDRLAKIGLANMSPKDKMLFKALAEHRKDVENRTELGRLGVSKDVYESKEFKEFSSKFNPNTPIKDIVDIYNKTIPKKEIEPMGSVKNVISDDSKVKDFYTREEALKFTRKELDKNPELVKAIENSMTKWKR